LYVISLNTLVYNSHDVSDDVDIKNEQLAWFEKQLIEAGNDDKFILISHIYETAGGDGGGELNWTEDDY
jgi:3',5'-cyclic AMP phosphodiesterase CpdA